MIDVLFAFDPSMKKLCQQFINWKFQLLKTVQGQNLNENFKVYNFQTSKNLLKEIFTLERLNIFLQSTSLWCLIMRALLCLLYQDQRSKFMFLTLFVNSRLLFVINLFIWRVKLLSSTSNIWTYKFNLEHDFESRLDSRKRKVIPDGVGNCWERRITKFYLTDTKFAIQTVFIESESWKMRF